MKIGKVLRYTAMASAIAVLAFAGKGAYAGNGGDSTGALVDGVFQAHVGASVIATTTMVEHDPVSFGNLSIPNSLVTAGTLTLSPAGLRTAATGIIPLNGQYDTGGTGSATDSLYGAARAGSYTVTGDPGATIYVTYLNGTGGGGVGVAGATPINATNFIQLNGPGGDTGLTVTALTDDGTVIAPGDIYAGDATSSLHLDNTTGKANLHIGGTLTAAATHTFPDGAYRGVFDIMLHY